MQNSEFEKNMQQKMQELKLLPSNAVWENVEASLPNKKKSRRWIIFIFLLATLFTTGLFWNNFNEKNLKNGTRSAAPTKQAINETFKKEKNNSVKNVDTIKTPKKYDLSIDDTKNGKEIFNSSTKISFKNTMLNARNKIVVSNHIAAKEKLAKKVQQQNANTKIISTNADSSRTNFVAFSNTNEKPLIKKLINIDTILKANTAIARDNKSKIDSLVVSKIDTNTKSAIKKLLFKTQKRNYIYGVEFALGSSNVKSNLFNNSSVFLNSLAISSGTVNITNGQAAPNNPTKSISFGIGFYVEKYIGNRWKFTSGINYLYQSNNLQLGNKVDSSVNYNINSTSFYSTNFFKTGSNFMYKNKFRYIEIPFLLSRSISKNLPVHINNGISIAYLVNSNALIFNNNSFTYFTSPTAFNKMLLFFNSGVEFNIAKKYHQPFLIGYQFKYSFSSATKSVFNNQHLQSSLLYLKISLKK